MWGLDAPEDLGGHDLPTRTMAAVHEELGRTCVPFVLPPDLPNLRMLQAVGTDAQKKKYLQPYIEGQNGVGDRDLRAGRRRRSGRDEDAGGPRRRRNGC